MNRLVNLKSFFPALSTRQAYPFFNLQEEIGQVFDEFYKQLGSDTSVGRGMENLIIRPAFDILENEKEYKVELEMPGLSEEDIQISIRKGELYIQAKKEVSRKDERKEYLRREIGYGSYESYISLPKYVDINKAKASFKKGMLWVSFPKTEQASQSVKKLTVEKIE